VIRNKVIEENLKALNILLTELVENSVCTETTCNKFSYGHFHQVSYLKYNCLVDAQAPFAGISQAKLSDWFGAAQMEQPIHGYSSSRCKVVQRLHTIKKDIEAFKIGLLKNWIPTVIPSMYLKTG
jgi:hypothetical protein